MNNIFNFKNFLYFLFFSLATLNVFAKVEIVNLASGQKVDPTLFSSTEDFFNLDPINVVYGLGINFNKDFKDATNLKVLDGDLPESDLSFLKTVTKNDSLVMDSQIIQESPKLLNTDSQNQNPSSETNFYLIGSKSTYLVDSEGNKKFQVIWEPEKKGLINRNCSDKIISLREVSKKVLPDVVAVSCNLSISPSIMTISLLKDSKWLSSTLLEISGKNQRYRTYQIPQGNTKGTASGSIKLFQNSQLYQLAVFLKKVEEKPSSFSLGFNKYVGLGLASNSISGGEASASSSSYYYEFQGQSENMLDFLYVGVGFFSTFSMGEDPTVISARDSKLSLGYSSFSNKESDFNWSAWLGHRNFDLKQDSSSTKFQSSQIGLGADVEYILNPKQKITGSFEMSNFGSKVVSSHMKISAGYKHNLVIYNREYRTGFKFETQSMTIKTSVGDSRGLSMTKIGITLDF